MHPPVVITGMGAVSVFGDGCDVLFDALRDGRSGFHPLRGIPVARGKDLSAQIDDPARRGPWRLSDMAADAATEALEQAGLALGADGFEDLNGVPAMGVTGLFVATTGGDSRALEDRYQEFLDATAASASDDAFIDEDLGEALIRFAPGALADELAYRLRLEGPRYVATNACASGTVALGLALTALRAGHIDRAVVIGADQVKASSYWGAERSGFIGHSSGRSTLRGTAASLATVLARSSSCEPRMRRRITEASSNSQVGGSPAMRTPRRLRRLSTAGITLRRSHLPFGTETWPSPRSTTSMRMEPALR